MKKTLLLMTVLVSLSVEIWAQKPAPGPDKLSNAVPCVPRQGPKRTRCPTVQAVAPAPVETPADFFVGEALVEVTKDQTVVRLAMAQNASVLIELPVDDGPRYIIPGDPEMVTVDQKALERNKRAIILRPGSLFVVPAHNQKRRAPAATVTAQMRSGLVVTFLFYPVADLAQNVHRCVLSYKRDEVVARRRAAGLSVNLDQKEQGGEKSAGQSGASISISVEPIEAKTTTVDALKNFGSMLSNENAPQSEIKLNPVSVSNNVQAPLAIGTVDVNERAVSAAKMQFARATANQQAFKNWTRPLHGLSLVVLQDLELKEDFRVLLLGVKNTSTRALKLIPGTPDLVLEMHEDKGKVINVQSLKPLHIEGSEIRTVAAGGKVYYAMAYTPPPMGVGQRLRIVVAQTDAADEPASIVLPK